jgi:hypothetical protein
MAEDASARCSECGAALVPDPESWRMTDLEGGELAMVCPRCSAPRDVPASTSEREALDRRLHDLHRAWTAIALSDRDDVALAMAELLRSIVIAQGSAAEFRKLAKQAHDVCARHRHALDVTARQALDALREAMDGDASEQPDALADRLLSRLQWYPSLELRQMFPELVRLEERPQLYAKALRQIAKDYKGMLERVREPDPELLVKRGLAAALGLRTNDPRIKNLFPTH